MTPRNGVPRPRQEVPLLPSRSPGEPHGCASAENGPSLAAMARMPTTEGLRQAAAPTSIRTDPDRIRMAARIVRPEETTQRRPAALRGSKLTVPAVAACALALVAACEYGSDPFVPTSPTEALGPSVAMAAWVPGPLDTCSAEIHDRYTVVGPDGLLYPTWHPPVDPLTGCSFGHEHGRDPRGSRLHRTVGDIPFGYANSRLDIWDPFGPRHEDHVGHKIEWQNDVPLRFGGAGSAVLEIRCDVLTKLHQGTHSADAFTNNLHELAYHIACTDGTRIHVTMMAAIGKPGEFVSSCDRDRHVHAGVPTPLNSPSGGGKRRIPDRECIDRILSGAGGKIDFGPLRESWETSNQIRAEGGQSLAFFNPYFQVFLPSRYFEPSLPGHVGRPLAACLPGTLFHNAFTTAGPCGESTANGANSSVAWDHPLSRFNGVRRLVDVNQNRITNADGPEIWYTDPFGRNARVEPFPGSIRQFIAAVDNSGRTGHGPQLGRDRNYGGPGVRAPN